MFYKILLVFFLNLITLNLYAENNKIILASTSSTYDTGLLEYINKKFEKSFNIDVHVIVLGTGQAIKVAKNGDADILLVHHATSELEFVKNGYGIKRHKLMYNDYIIVGPKFDNDKCETIEQTLQKIKNNKLLFISRGDESGTHKKEKNLWNKLQFDHEKFSSWYIKIGQGMGATLIMANEINGYTLTDRGTWIVFNKRDNLKIICENKPPLINQYGIIAVNPKINSKINSVSANKYINWIISNEGKKLINNFKKNNEQLFFFNYY